MKSIVNPLNIRKLLLKLESASLEHSEFIGILCCIIHSKEIFQRNKDIDPFLERVFGFKYLQYILNSRTLISARLVKYVLQLNEEELDEIRKKIVDYFKKLKSEYGQTNKRKNANDKLNIWLKGL